MKSPVRVIVEPAPNRKGWHWRQVGRKGATAAVSPKNYDTKAIGKRAGERQVDVLNGSLGHFGFSEQASNHLASTAPYASLEVRDA